MAHRGPDAAGVWIAPGVGFAHTRLSLVDLSDAANQPWCSDGDALVFNGEIYNFKALRSELERSGRQFQTTSDTEVLFHALQEYGLEGALSRVRGMFAFAFHHGASGTTHLVRDRYGIKPLLFLATGAGVIFASEVKAIMTVADVEIDDTLALLFLRALGDTSKVRTVFRGVNQVAPGCVVSVRDGEVIADMAYAPLLDSIDPGRFRLLQRASFDDVCAELASLLESSVETMANCDARLGVFLSGGVDSSLIAAMAAGQGHDHFRAFTSDVTGTISERQQAQEVADRMQIQLEVSRFGPDDWAKDWVHATWHLETPVITNPSSIPFARVASLAHGHGYKAVLTGEGADELFLGYPRLISGGLERIAGSPVTAIRHLYRKVPGLADAVLNERDSNSNDFLRGVVGGFDADELTANAIERYDFLDTEKAKLQAVSAVMMETSLQALLQRNDRMGMAASIESRFPFLDEEVVAFALNLPADSKIRRSLAIHNPKHPFLVDKAPVRSIASRYLGTEVADRRKSGFPTPGLRSIRVRPGAFVDSWSADAFGAGRSFDHQLAEWRQPYDVAKLLSIEIFGRLFGRREPLEMVQAYVRDVVVSPV